MKRFLKLALTTACLSVGVANAADTIQNGDLEIIGTTFTHLWSNQPQGTAILLGLRNKSEKPLAPRYELDKSGNQNLTLSLEYTSTDPLCHDQFIPNNYICWFTVRAIDTKAKDSGNFIVKVKATNPKDGSTLIDEHPIHYVVDAHE